MEYQRIKFVLKCAFNVKRRLVGLFKKTDLCLSKHGILTGQVCIEMCV